MEVFSFNTGNVEKKLYDVNGAIQAVKLAVDGLRFNTVINDVQQNGLLFVLDEADRTIQELVNSIKPVPCRDYEKLVISEGGKK